MPKLFEDRDFSEEDEVEIKTDNEYAKKYDTWRNKEELNKLKSKYGEEVLLDQEDGSSSSSSDEEEAPEINEEDDKKFFRTLSYLIAKKDPGTICDDDTDENRSVKNSKKKKEQPTFLKDYERKLLLEKGGVISDSDEDEDMPRARSPTYVEEQRRLKESLKGVLNTIEESEDEDETFKPRAGTSQDNTNNSDYKEWLAGHKEKLENEELEEELKPLKDYWNDPNLDEGEKFLRDYILNKRYLEKEDENYCPTYDEIVQDPADLSEDERELEKQEEFEYKYNFRFEEPDPEFIKTYPRTLANSVRKTDDRRKVKRQEIKERKQKEKQQKIEELEKLKELKHKEIEEKIAKLKEVTGNTEVGFEDEDIDGDFDPEAHDRRMQMLFNDEFYQGPEGDQKPEFPDLDEELEIENWNKWQGNEEDGAEDAEITHEPHCEDENFNMDCDYDPQAVQKEMLENSKGRKKRRRKSKFAEAVSKPKPQFDPNDKTYEEYLDEYYKLDCEDFIGDIPCRFKYRKVVPNDFGLTVEEILMANDRELNKWCSVKKAVQHRPDHIEKYDQIAYAKKAQNIELKKRILPSLFKEEEPKTENNEDSGKVKSKDKMAKHNTSNNEEIERNNENNAQSKNKAKNKHKKREEQTHIEEDEGVRESIEPEKETTNVDSTEKQTSVESSNPNTVQKSKKKKKKKKKNKNKQTHIEGNSNEARQKHNTNTSEVGKTKKLRKDDKQSTSEKSFKISKNKKRKAGDSNQDNIPKKKFKMNKEPHNQKNSSVKLEVSDARLASFGYNPKKYKNKIKYGNKLKS